MPDGEEVVMIMTARSIHEARPGFGSQVRCLCVAVISPRNKKNVCQPGLILFIGLFWGLCIVLAVWLCGCFEVLLFNSFRGVLPRSRRRRCCRCCMAMAAIAFPAWQSVSQSAKV